MFRKLRRNKKLVAIGAVVGSTVSTFAAQATVYGQDVNVSTTEVLSIAGVVIAGSLVIWGIRKSVALSNKS